MNKEIEEAVAHLLIVVRRHGMETLRSAMDGYVISVTPESAPSKQGTDSSGMPYPAEPL